MNAILTSQASIVRYTFSVEHNGDTFEVTLYVDDKGKFIDTQVICPNNGLLDLQGEEGELHEEIINHLDNNWSDYVKRR